MRVENLCLIANYTCIDGVTITPAAKVLSRSIGLESLRLLLDARCAYASHRTALHCCVILR